MIQWIALAVALDGNSKAGQARDAANDANHAARSGVPMVIIRPVELVKVPNGEPEQRFLGIFSYTPKKEVLAKEPWSTYSIKKSDILNMQEFKDDDGTKFCRLQISEYAKVTKYKEGEGHVTQIAVYIPGSIEQVAGAIGGL